MAKWIAVKDKKPYCKRDPNALGTPVLVLPRLIGEHGIAFYGKRATGKPCFYLYGAPLCNVTHWMPLPEPPYK